MKKITQNSCDSTRGYYGTVGDNAVIKSCRIIKDVRFGAAVYIKGANKLKNLTVRSSVEEATQIGEGVELVNGIIGYGCRVFYGVKAVRFVLLNKGNYPAELDIPFPFSLVSDNLRENCLDIMPVYFWMYNMYALVRNNDKFKKRDKRKTETQKIETAVLACDTAGEIMHAMALLENIFEAAWTAAGNPPESARDLLAHKREKLRKLSLTAENIEHSARPVRILHGVDSWYAYRDMLVWYGVTVLAQYMDENGIDGSVVGRFNLQHMI